MCYYSRTQVGAKTGFWGGSGEKLHVVNHWLQNGSSTNVVSGTARIVVLEYCTKVVVYFIDDSQPNVNEY